MTRILGVWKAMLRYFWCQACFSLCMVWQLSIPGLSHVAIKHDIIRDGTTCQPNMCLLFFFGKAVNTE